MDVFTQMFSIVGNSKNKKTIQNGYQWLVAKYPVAHSYNRIINGSKDNETVVPG